MTQRILAGVLPAGSPLPSVTDLALQLLCHPSSVEMAYKELAKEGWILEMASGVHTVTSQGETRRERALEAGLERLIERAIDQALELETDALAGSLQDWRKTWLQRSQSKE